MEHAFIVFAAFLLYACGRQSGNDGNEQRSQADMPVLADSGQMPSSLTADGPSFIANWSAPGKGGNKAYFFRQTKGVALAEGDIAFPVREADDVSGPQPQAGVGLSFTGSRWPDGIVPYEMTSEVAPEPIEAAIRHWEEQTPIRFRQRTTEADYIRFVSGDSDGNCWSYLGRIGGAQNITLAPNCSFGPIVHEIGHAMGLHHEQNRQDRDAYITVLWENIQRDYWPQFQKADAGAEDLVAYDFNSIMHYGSYYFSANQKPSMVKKDGSLIQQNRQALSEGDVRAIKMMYGDVSNQGGEKEKLAGNVIKALDETLAKCRLSYALLSASGDTSSFKVLVTAMTGDGRQEKATLPLYLELKPEIQIARFKPIIPAFLLSSCR